MKTVIGIISDTHGILSEKVKDCFQDVELIIHAGDIGSEDIFFKLKEQAPVVAVLGNTDRKTTFPEISQYEMITVGEKIIYVLHDLNKLDLVPQKAGVSIVIHGHTHCAEAVWENKVLYLNPGSASFSRSKEGPTVALITVTDDNIQYAFQTV